MVQKGHILRKRLTDVGAQATWSLGNSSWSCETVPEEAKEVAWKQQHAGNAQWILNRLKREKVVAGNPQLEKRKSYVENRLVEDLQEKQHSSKNKGSASTSRYLSHRAVWQ
jgi:hypothetical protein